MKKKELKTLGLNLFRKKYFKSLILIFYIYFFFRLINLLFLFIFPNNLYNKRKYNFLGEGDLKC
jgi:hypothetical protein